MSLSALAGKPAPVDLLIDPAKLVGHYFDTRPDPTNTRQQVSFGTSGHRGTALDGTFNEAHILAITQAICEFRQMVKITGPLFLGKDTHALSDPAQRTALEVLAANGVAAVIQAQDQATPTPVISHAILTHNRGRQSPLADGIVITPSHNPPADGGFKYNLPNGGPADTDVTQRIQERANELMRGGGAGVRRLPLDQALRAATTQERDFIQAYVDDLRHIIDMNIIRAAGLKIGVDPLGGASLHYWERIKAAYGLDITVVNPVFDPRFAFMTVDHDGKIRMDCSSPHAMAKLVELKNKYDVAFGNDPDADRHGIVTRSAGLMNPNHYLAVAIRYLFTHRPQLRYLRSDRQAWSPSAGIGKTLVSSSIIDRVAQSFGRPIVEVPVGFKWFAPGLLAGSLGFGGEESAGASFLRMDGTVWTTDKDGLILGLLAAEITARTGKDPGVHFQEIARDFGTPYYTRLDAPASAAERDILKKLSPEAVKANTLAGEPILAKLTKAPGNNASIGGLKVVAQSGWFAARPSGTENIYKIYAESLRDQPHLQAIVAEAQAIVGAALRG